MSSAQSLTVGEFSRMDWNGVELRDGKVGEAGQGGVGAIIAGALRLALHEWAKEHRAWVFGSGCGWVVDDLNVRNPSAMVVMKARFPRLTPDPLLQAPDLTADVVAFYETLADAVTRVERDVALGVPLAWAIDPAGRRAVVVTAGDGVRELGQDGILDGEDVLPGFTCSLQELFDAAKPEA